MYTTPKGFLLIALNNAESSSRMVVHLVRGLKDCAGLAF